MKASSIDRLMAELGQELPLGTGEEYRARVVRYVKGVFKKVGYDKTCIPLVAPYTIEGYAIDPLPEDVLDVLDAGFMPTRMTGEVFGSGINPDNPLSMQLTPFGISFPNYEYGDVYLKVLKLPVDENQQVVIHEEMYQACVDTCYWRLLKTFYRHPAYSQWPMLENRADGEIDKARAWFNKRGRQAHNRGMRRFN